MVSSFILPMLIMIVLTAIVLGIAIVSRISEIRTRRIKLQLLARASETAKVLQNTQAIDNFNNLMQLPVLFYLLCLVLVLIGNRTDVFFLIGTWLFVALRILHSVIQITYNRVLHRFSVWATSSLVLFALWAKFGFMLLIK